MPVHRGYCLGIMLRVVGGACQLLSQDNLEDVSMAVHSRYLDLAAKIRARIEEGEWEPGARLPTLDAFAAEYSANRDTVGRAISALEAQGVVWAVQGRGVTVRHGTMQ